MLNGTQTQSARVYNLIEELPQMQAMGVDPVPEPQPQHGQVIACLTKCAASQPTPRTPKTASPPLMPDWPCNGFLAVAALAWSKAAATCTRHSTTPNAPPPDRAAAPPPHVWIAMAPTRPFPTPPRHPGQRAPLHRASCLHPWAHCSRACPPTPGRCCWSPQLNLALARHLPADVLACCCAAAAH